MKPEKSPAVLVGLRWTAPVNAPAAWDLNRVMKHHRKPQPFSSQVNTAAEKLTG